jgi:ATP phosphoribosyltransferase
MGVVGKDLLLEQGRDVYEPLDLGFGACRLVVAEPAALRLRDDPRAWTCLRVATKYPRLTERHFSQKGVQVEIVHLSGSIELAPVMGLAERIVDLVATGRTLKENGLVEVEEILKASARLIVNRASLKTRYQAIQGVIEGLRMRVTAVQGGLR